MTGDHTSQREPMCRAAAWVLSRELWGRSRPPDWHKRAACAGENAWWWEGRSQQVERARAVCHTCPVLSECLSDAIAWEIEDSARRNTAVGVRGGLSGPERSALYKALPQTVKAAAVGARRRRMRRWL
jgi:hypothetical protein